jgi:predicted DNA-binding transcriptional regulator AlpA
MLEPNRNSRRHPLALRRHGHDDDELRKMIDAVGGDPLLDARRTRKYCGDISDMTLWRWTETLGFPPADYTIGNRRFWRLSSIEAWLARQEAGLSSDRPGAVPVQQEVGAMFQKTLGKKSALPDSDEANPAQQRAFL